MSDEYGTVEAPGCEDTRQRVTSDEWIVFGPHEQGSDKINEIRVHDKPVFVEAYGLTDADCITFYRFQADGPCNPRVSAPASECGKTLMLSCASNGILLTRPGRYAPIRHKHSAATLYLHHEAIPVELAALQTCCCGP